MNMAKICYGVAGEGRGHAARVRTIVEDLAQRHEILIFASHQALKFLRKSLKNPNIRILPIPGFRFCYNKEGHLDPLLTILDGIRTLGLFSRKQAKISRQIQDFSPNLIISDFEPMLPRVAKEQHIPFISVDHQHFLTHYDLSNLPLTLQIRAGMMARFVEWFCRGQQATIISSFYFPPVKPSMMPTTTEYSTEYTSSSQDGEMVVQTGVLLRDEIRLAKPVKGQHYTAYIRRKLSDNLIKALQALDCPVHIFGPAGQNNQKNLHFYPVDPDSFTASLVSCRALICTAGNQLIGEAIYLGKPVLAFPESGNFEQQINGHFINETKAGLCIDQNDLSAEMLQNFDHSLEKLEYKGNRLAMCANAEVIRNIEANLQNAESLTKSEVA